MSDDVKLGGLAMHLAVLSLTAIGGGLLLAKNCLIIWPRK